MKRKLKFNQAINEAIYQAMKSDKKIVCYGLGVTDPRRVFYSTERLVEEFEMIEFLIFQLQKML